MLKMPPMDSQTEVPNFCPIIINFSFALISPYFMKPDNSVLAMSRCGDYGGGGY